MSYGTNGDITLGGTAQDLLDVGHQFHGIIFQNTSDTAMYVKVCDTDADEAAADDGTLVAAGASTHFGELLGRRVSLFCVTTSKTFTWRQASGESLTWGNIGGDVEDQEDIIPFIDDSVDDAVAARVLTSYLASTVTYNNDDTLSDTALSVDVEAATKYAIELRVYTSSAVSPLQLDFNGTSTVTAFKGVWSTSNFDDPATYGGLMYGLFVTSIASTLVAGITAAKDNCIIQFSGSVLTNAAGTFLLRGAQDGADASNTTIQAGSTLVLTKLD